MSASLVAGLVIDASAAAELLLRTSTGLRVRERLSAVSFAASPAHVDAEVLSALARMVRAGSIEDRFVDPALTELSAAPIVRLPLRPLLAGAWGLRNNVAMRDALYVILARRLDAELLTADGALARSPALGVTVTFVGEEPSAT